VPGSNRGTRQPDYQYGPVAWSDDVRPSDSGLPRSNRGTKQPNYQCRPYAAWSDDVRPSDSGLHHPMVAGQRHRECNPIASCRHDLYYSKVLVCHGRSRSSAQPVQLPGALCPHQRVVGLTEKCTVTRPRRCEQFLACIAE